MKNKKYFLFALIITTQLFASGGSLYTRYGIGDLNHSGSAIQLSLGGLGIALNDSRYINTHNPATLFDIKDTRFGAGVSSNTSFLNDGVTDATYSHVKFSGFHIAFPIKESLGMGFILGMAPYSVTNYNVINSVNSSIGDNFDETFEGAGGISKVFLGVSYLLPADIAFGATFDYYTGNVQYKSSYSYVDSSGLFDSYFIDEYKYKGLGVTLGLESPDLSKVFGINEITNFRLGATYEISGAINTTNSVLARTTIGDKIFKSSDIETNLPAKLGIGLNLTLSDKYLLILDYLYQPWSKYEQNNQKSEYLRDLTRYSLGFELGQQTKRFATFWELVKFRGGLSYEQSQYEIGVEGINQIGFHTGISIPLGLENSIDIGLMYGIRGTTDFNLLKENILQASFSLNFGELWFVRRER
jgi:hypothetical protein